MVKGILEFELPQDEEAFVDAQNGSRWKFVLQGFDNWLRSKAKYGSNQETTFGAVRERLHEYINEGDLQLF